LIRSVSSRFFLAKTAGPTEWCKWSRWNNKRRRPPPCPTPKRCRGRRGIVRGVCTRVHSHAASRLSGAWAIAFPRVLRGRQHGNAFAGALLANELHVRRSLKPPPGHLASQETNEPQSVHARRCGCAGSILLPDLGCTDPGRGPSTENFGSRSVAHSRVFY